MGNWLARWRRSPPGARGERLAAKHLKRAGYRILTRNLRSRLGEIDILAEAPDRHTIVIVEVKSGSGGSVPPEAHLTRAKQRKLVSLAAQLLRRYRLTQRPLRFDLIAVELPPRGAPVVRHHEGAFEAHV